MSVAEITCDFIATARPVDKATSAERLVNSYHRVTQCEKCKKFHVWVEVSPLEWSGAAKARFEAGRAFYVQVGPNSYLHREPTKKRKGKAGKVDDNDED